MTPKPVALLIVIIVSGFMMMNYACKTESEFSSLRWPPDTIKAVWVSGDIYEVTTSPVAKDPLMKIVLTMRPLPPPPDPLGPAPWPPDTFFQPLEVQFIWEPGLMPD